MTTTSPSTGWPFSAQWLRTPFAQHLHLVAKLGPKSGLLRLSSFHLMFHPIDMVPESSKKKWMIHQQSQSFSSQSQAPCQKWAYFSLSVRLIGQASPLRGLICWDIPKRIIPIDPLTTKKEAKDETTPQISAKCCLLVTSFVLRTVGGPRYRL